MNKFRYDLLKKYGGKLIEIDVIDVNNIWKCYEGNFNYKIRLVMIVNL